MDITSIVITIVYKKINVILDDITPREIVI